ncbi:MAG: ATP-dependent metallopeptidase FtsH/Yme1/Tma family protein, partial [Paracoccaceae bacterium]|nr:ATP-dependent metallopeptidase FtsH/Yme1/Tma family protein [Paracoccaceae bacterium]
MGNARNVAFWVVLFLLVLALFNLFSGNGASVSSQQVSYSQFVDSVESGNVSTVTLDGEQIRFESSDGNSYQSIKPSDAKVSELLIAADVPFAAESQETSGLQSFLISLLPFLLLVGVWIYFMNRMQGGGKGG